RPRRYKCWPRCAAGVIRAPGAELARRDENPHVASIGSRGVPRTSTRISPWLHRNFGVPNRSARTGGPVTKRKTFAWLAASAAAASCALSVSALQGSANAAAHAPAPASKHVLLISVDGMHQNDLDWYVANHPSSTLAKLTHSGSEYTNALTSNPSDSDPGGTALMTGGNPKSTGVYYDVEYSHKVDEAGAACTPGRPATGGDVVYDSPDDALAKVPDFVDPSDGSFPSFDENGSIYAGGVDTDPSAIMNLKFDPSTSLNPATFPV